MSDESLTMAQALRLYDHYGFCVIPLRPKDKRPALPEWAAYQQRRSVRDEWERWWPDAIPGNNYGPGDLNNLAVVTGDVSNLVVLDLDDDQTYGQVLEAMPWLSYDKTMTVQTGRGWHVYLRPTVPAGATTSFKLNGSTHHIKADGGYVVAPPSLHANGSVYTVYEPGIPPLDFNPTDLVEGLVKLGIEPASPESKAPPPQDWVGKLLTEPCPQGQRNSTATRLAGWFRDAIVYRQDVTLAILKLWNRQYCSPPMPERELEALVSHKYRAYLPPPMPKGLA